MRSPRFPLAAACACAGLLAACQGPGGDHLLLVKLRDSMARLGHSLDPRPHLDRAVSDLGHLQQTAWSLAPWGPAAVRRLERLPERARDGILAPEIGRPRNLATVAVSLADHDVQALGSMTRPDSALRTLTSPERAASRLRHAADTAQTVLELDRQPLPGPTDPDRQTGTAPAGPTETWLERILRRIPF